MTMSILNIISWTSIFSQLLLVIFYSLGVLFYKYNKSVSQGLYEHASQTNTNESVEYFSQEVNNSIPTKEADFENYDDYSAFSKEKSNEVNASKSTTEGEENELEVSEQKPKIIEDSDEDYVSQNAIPTATIEDEDFEQISFNLPTEQENSITMVDEEDIKRVFQKQDSSDWAVRHQQVNH